MTVKVNILLVEDDEIDIQGVRRACRKLGVTNPLTIARDGVEALEILREQEGRGPRPYLILLDLNMPRMGGIEFLRELRKDPRLHDSIVFVLTTSRAEDDMSQAYDLNIAGYIVKADAEKSFQEAVRMLDRYSQIVEFP